MLGSDIPRLMEALPRSIASGRRLVVDLAKTYLPNCSFVTKLVSICRHVGESLDDRAFPHRIFCRYDKTLRGLCNELLNFDMYVEAKATNPWEEESANESWALHSYVSKYTPSFNSVAVDGFVSGKAAKDVLMASGLAVGTLRKIWDLSDIDKDGKLDLHEFVVASYLAEMVAQGKEVPPALDPSQIPPGK